MYHMELTKSCEVCGSPIRLLRADARFCSARCRVNWNRNRNMPLAMRRRTQWVRYSATKRPLNPHTGRLASVTDPSTWSDWPTARDSPYGIGAGFVLTDGSLVVWDLDHALDDDGQPEQWAADALAAHGPDALLVERSMSGTGLHIITAGNGTRLPCHPDPTNKRVECWTADRYIAMTGDIYRLEK